MFCFMHELVGQPTKAFCLSVMGGGWMNPRGAEVPRSLGGGGWKCCVFVFSRISRGCSLCESGR